MGAAPPTCVLAIDPNNCFTDAPGAPLAVPGACEDWVRAAGFILANASEISAVFVPWDTHPLDHIGHANRWMSGTCGDEAGGAPAPFTLISAEGYESGRWRAAQAEDQQWQSEYLRRLEANGRQHIIWPVHGQEGTWEHDIADSMKVALNFWERTTGKKVRYIKKGMHRDTEQFGVFGAEVPFPGAQETEIQQNLIDEINRYDRPIVVGQASSHCVMSSMNQLFDHIPKADIAKYVLFEDCMSPVPQPPGGPDFPTLAATWLAQCTAKGATVTTSRDFRIVA